MLLEPGLYTSISSIQDVLRTVKANAAVTTDVVGLATTDATYSILSAILLPVNAHVFQTARERSAAQMAVAACVAHAKPIRNVNQGYANVSIIGQVQTVQLVLTIGILHKIVVCAGTTG